MQVSPCVGDTQAEKFGPSSGDIGESNNALTSPGEFEFNAIAGPFSV